MGSDSISMSVNDLFKSEKWPQARNVLEQELQKTPDSHWVLDRLSVTYYEQRQYQTALKYIKKAFAQAPNCPLVLWDFAGTCAALGQTDKAIQKYGTLIELYPDGFSKDECGEDMNWASSLVMDCFFRLGVCFQALKTNDMARLFFEDYINLRKKHKSLPSLYSATDAKKRKAMVEKYVSVSTTNSVLPEARRAHERLKSTRLKIETLRPHPVEQINV